MPAVAPASGAFVSCNSRSAGLKRCKHKTTAPSARLDRRKDAPKGRSSRALNSQKNACFYKFGIDRQMNDHQFLWYGLARPVLNHLDHANAAYAELVTTLGAKVRDDELNRSALRRAGHAAALLPTRDCRQSGERDKRGGGDGTKEPAMHTHRRPVQQIACRAFSGTSEARSR
jgi:hypothetical protein